MTKNLIVSILAVSLVCTVTAKTAPVDSKKAELLMDGFVLAGADGSLISKDGNEPAERWFFRFDSDISDDRGHIKAGTVLELLPSTVLEKMTADAKEHPRVGYRLWGSITRYKDRNFIFGVYFLPISKIEQPQSQILQESQQTKSRLAINEPNDALTIPAEVIAKLQRRRIVRIEQLRKGLELKQDSVLADRTGFIIEADDGCDTFVLDALGRGVQKFSLRLLPCQTLQRTKRTQADEMEQLRFKVAGIVTKYKGDYYLLLQQATRVYSYGNFQ